MTLPRQRSSSSQSLPAVTSEDLRRGYRPTRAELERAVAKKLREVQERTKEVSDGIESGNIDISDLAE